MCALQLHPNLTACLSPLLPAGSDAEMSPDTIESSMVTVGPREDFINSAIDSLDDVPYLPKDASDVPLEPSSYVELPDPSPYLTFVRD